MVRLDKDFQHHPGYGKTPDNYQKRPTPRALQYSQRKGRICTCNKKEDGGMLDNLEKLLGLADGERVVEGRREIEDDHRCGKNIYTSDESGISLLQRMHDQERHSDECSNQGNAMTNAVGDLFPS